MDVNDIPIEGLLGHLENNIEVSFHLRGFPDYTVEKVIPQLLKVFSIFIQLLSFQDISSYEKDDPIPIILFRWKALVNIPSILPNFYLVYRSIEFCDEYSRACYALAVPKRIILVLVLENPLRPYQAMTFFSTEKDKNSLRKGLSANVDNCTFDDTLMDHIFETVVGEE